MTWTSPTGHLAYAGQVVTSSWFNTYTLNNILDLSAPPMCRVTASSTSTVSNATWTLIAFDGETFDAQAMHSTSTNNSRIYAPVAGIYFVQCVTGWTEDVDNVRSIQIRKNAAGSSSGGTKINQMQVPATSPGNTTVHVSDMVELAVNDYLEFFRYQASGGNLAPVSIGDSPASAFMARVSIT